MSEENRSAMYLIMYENYQPIAVIFDAEKVVPFMVSHTRVAQRNLRVMYFNNSTP
jgi:hypothetical protein